MRLALITVALSLVPAVIGGQAADALLSRVKQERGAFIKTLQELVSIESGSRDIEGLNRLSEDIAGRLRALGGDVQFVAPATDGIRFQDTPAQIGRIVLARFKGTGTRNILLLAHMDTVYERGMAARQPFRIEGDRAYGLGIEDDKQGIALILHTLTMLRALGSREYGTLTVLINADEEIGAPGSRGAHHASRTRARRGPVVREWRGRSRRSCAAGDDREWRRAAQSYRPRVACRRGAGRRP